MHYKILYWSGDKGDSTAFDIFDYQAPISKVYPNDNRFRDISDS